MSMNYDHIDSIVDATMAQYPDWPRGVVEESVVRGFLGGIDRAKEISCGVIRSAIKDEEGVITGKPVFDKLIADALKD